MTETIPASHRDLVSDEKWTYAVLSTVMDDGSPQASPIWFDMKGDYIRFNTARGRVKDRNIQARPEVALTMMDPEDPYRYLLVRGRVVEESEEGAEEHIAHLAGKYRGKAEYDVPEGQVRVIYLVEPHAVHAS
ncbi:MAG: PPOX class F420-dependent oxidoreductase [Anaerolineales bacterium]